MCRLFFFFFGLLFSVLVRAQDPNMVYYNQHCELIGKPFSDPKVLTFFPMAELNLLPGNPGTYSKGVYLAVSSERPVMDTVRCITRFAANFQEGNFPGGVPPYSKAHKIKSILGEPVYKLNDTIVYFYDKNIAAEFILKKGYAATVRIRQVDLWDFYYTAPDSILMEHPSKIRFIKYNNQVHPTPYPAGAVVRRSIAEPLAPVVVKPEEYIIVSPVSTSFIYSAYETDHRYYKKQFSFTGNSMSNGKMQGTLRLNNMLHMSGWFKSHQYYRYSPDKAFLSTLYDITDSTIFLQANFDSYQTINQGTGLFIYKGKRYAVKVLNQIGLFGRPGDYLSNQYFIDYFKYQSKNGTADTAIELTTEKVSYDVWYLTAIKKESLKPSPVIVKMKKEQAYLNGLLDATASEYEKYEDKLFYLNERVAGGIEGAAPFSKTFYPGTDKWEKFLLVFFVPSKYILNMQYKAERTYYINGNRVTEPIKTDFEKIDLGNGVTSYRQIVGLPEKTDQTCCPGITVTLWRTANNA